MKPLPINATYGQHNGQTIFVTATSASLAEVDLSLIRDYPKIAVNRAIRRVQANYLVFTEPDAYDAVKEEVDRIQPLCLVYRPTADTLIAGGKFRNSRWCSLCMEDRDGHVRNSFKDDFEWEPIPPEHPYFSSYQMTYNRDHRCRARIAKPGRMQLDGLFLRSNSCSIYATEWAFRMVSGPLPSRIVLLGIDFTTKRKNGKHLTFIPEINTMHVADLMCHGHELPCDSVAPHLGKAREVMVEYGVELISASPWEGPLDEFLPRIPLEEVVASDKTEAATIK